MKCDPRRVWYHGDQQHRLTFVDQRFQPQHGANAVGPGIYFTASREQARGYAWPSGWLYAARISGRCATDRQRMTPIELRRFLAMLSDEGREYLFSNYDDDPRRALSKIVAAYTTAGDVGIDLVSAAADLGRQGGLDYASEGRTWAKAMVKLGYVALLHRLPKVDHLVVWDPSALTIVEEEPVRHDR